MFHRERDASKAALAALVDHLRDRAFGLLDVQLLTPHLASLGAIEVAREAYLAGLAAVLGNPVTW
jgi:leucyl/phenylalanyl-tRNA--protein transferase